MATSAKIFRINYKSDFILTLTSDAGWMTPFCIKFWTGAPSQAYYVGWDGETYNHCSFDPSEPTKLQVQFDDHHLPIGDLKYQVAYHFTVADFPNDTEDEVINPANITTEIDGETYQVMLDFTGETAPEIQFALPAYANEAQRIANEQQRIAAETQRIANEETRIANEQTRINQEQTRQQNEQQRINQEQARVNEFATLKSQSQAATSAANTAATLANEKAQLAADKAALADAAATLANQKAQLAADKAALANAAAQLANEKAALAQQKADYAQTQGDYAKTQGDYAKEQGEIAEEDHERAEADHTRAESDHATAGNDHTQAGTDHTRAESDHATAAADHTQAGQDHTTAASDHGIAAEDHTQAGTDHTRAESDHGIAANDHTQAGNDHTRAESDHTRAESDHASVEVYVDSLGAFDISAYHATGGVLAKYADLTAALGTNGANIPDALRKGGMSVKFVLTSDNNYVQYRYMSDDASTVATFANIANWQGVDDVLVGGSHNLAESNAVAERLLSCVIYGKDNTFVTTTLKSLMPNRKYIIRIPEISHNNVTSGNTLSLSIKAVSTNGTETDIKVYLTSAYASIPEFYTFTTAQDFDHLLIGCRADVGTEVRFTVLPYDIYQQKFVYFSDAAVPSFSLSSNAAHLYVTLPSNKTLYIFSNYGIDKTIDLSQQATTSFDITSTQKLVYNYKTGNIEKVSSTLETKDGEMLTLLAVLGSPGHKGAIVGPLAGYYYAAKEYEQDGKLSDIIPKLAELDGDEFIVDKIYNGTPNNPNNTDAVRTYKIPITEYTSVEIFTDRPVSATGNKYVYAIMLRDKDGNVLQNLSNPTESQKKYTTLAGAATIEFGILEMSGSSYVTLRTTDFENYTIYIKTVSVRKEVTELRDRSELIAYFKNAASPTFSIVNNNKIKVVLPAQELIFYKSSGGTYDTIDLTNVAENNRTFELVNLRKLVIDRANNNNILLKSTDATGDYIVLLSVSGMPENKGGIDGLLRGYYVGWLNEKIKALQAQQDPDTETAKGNIQKWADFKCLFFSDVHAGWTNVQRIFDYATKLGAGNCDCVINGGDTVLATQESGVSDYDTIVEDNNSIPTLTVAGNHDCWTGSNWNWATAQSIYELITAKVKTNVPSIVQPTGAATNYLNYYYKDFGSVRVICLLAMQRGSNNLYFDTTQAEWLSDVLDDAKATYTYYEIYNASGVKKVREIEAPASFSGTTLTYLSELNDTTLDYGYYRVPMNVIIVTHAPFGKTGTSRVSEKLCSWLDIYSGCMTKGIAFDGIKVNDIAVEIVDDYIKTGGAFICWLTGHTHIDNVFKHETSYQDGGETKTATQFMVNINSAKYSNHNFDSYTTSDVNSANYDCFDYIGVDLKSGMIKVLRVGLAQDSSMRIKRSWCYDYVNHVLMSEN